MRLQQWRSVRWWRFMTAVVHRRKCEAEEVPGQPVSCTGRDKGIEHQNVPLNLNDRIEAASVDHLLCGVEL
jgi:hypothetical protein